MRSKKKWYIWLIIILIIGVGFFLARNNLQSNKVSETSSLIGKDIDLESTMEVKKGDLKRTISTSGYLQAKNESYLNLKISGTAKGGIVEEILIDTGDFVEKEQELIRLENKQEKLSYLKAKNEYELAKIDGSLSNIEEAKLTMELALDELEAKTITAPFSGKIVEIFVEEGDYVEQTDNMIYLIDNNSYEVDVSVSEVDCLEVEVGQQVEVQFDALEDKIFLGKVTEVANYAEGDSGVVTVPVTIFMEEISEYFKPGISADAEIIVDTVKDTLLVPLTALQKTKQGNTVLKIEDGKAVPIFVKLGISGEYYQEITDGLQEGDRIVVNQYQVEETTSTNGFPMGGGGMGGPRL